MMKLSAQIEVFDVRFVKYEPISPFDFVCTILAKNSKKSILA